jgi:multiple sugar transport system permease protein
VYVVSAIVFQVVIGTAAGILLNQKLRGQAAVRTILLIPWVVPGIVAATTWTWMFHNEFGIINYALGQLGIISKPVGWLTDPDIVMPSLVAVNVWKMFPFVAIMVLAALQTVPETLYEAARVDGAGFLDEVRHIMLPHLVPVLISVTMLLFIWGFNGITIIYAMTKGGPANQSLILPILIFKQAFEQFDFNEAAALSLMLFATMIVIVVAYLRMTQTTEEGDEHG